MEIGWSRDGQYLFSAGECELAVLKLADQSMSSLSDVHHAKEISIVQVLSSTSDKLWLATVGLEKTLKVWEISTNLKEVTLSYKLQLAKDALSVQFCNGLLTIMDSDCSLTTVKLQLVEEAAESELLEVDEDDLLENLSIEESQVIENKVEV